MKKMINNVAIECIKGDITSQPDIAAVVNAANAQLEMGGGVAGAIHKAAGPGLAEECRPKAPIEPGEAVLSGGHQLPNKYVIHCLGPVYGRDKPEDELLSKCYQNALDIVEKEEIDSVAFPAISTGAFGYPTQEAAEVAIKAVVDYTEKLETTELIRFVLFDKSSFEIHKNVLDQSI